MIDKVRVEPLENPRFVAPMRMIYRENGAEKSWELVKVHDSVAILIYNADREEFAIVRQFRPAVYLRNDDGFTYELCAGILDKNKSEEQTAIEEIEEETGFRIEPCAIERITGFFSSVGFAGSRQTLFFATVRERDRVGAGGGIDGENIEVIAVPIAKAREFIYDETKVKTSGLAFAFLWFFDRKAK